MRYTVWICNVTNDWLKPNQDHTGLKDGYKIFDTNWTGSEPKLVEASLKEAIGSIANFTFVIDKSNPHYDKLISRKTAVWIYEEDVIDEMTEEHHIAFAGHIIHIVESIDRNGVITKRVTCADNTDYLNDSVVPRHSYSLSVQTDVGKISGLVADHTTQIQHTEIEQGELSEKDLFIVQRNVTLHNNNYEYVVNWDKTYPVVRQIMERFGHEWTLSPQIELDGDNNEVYRMVIALYDQIGKTSSVDLQDGVNIQSLSVEKDETNVVTRLFPLGSTNDDGSSVLIPVRDTPSYSDSVHVSDLYNAIDNDDTIEDYGVISGINEWDDVTLPENLINKGKDYIQSTSCGVKIQYKGHFLDFAGKNNPEDRYCLGDTHRLVHSLLGVDDNVRIIGLTRDILKPWSVDLVLGDKFLNAEQQRDQETESIYEMIDEVYKHIGGV